MRNLRGYNIETRNYKVEVYDLHFHGVYRFHSLDKAKRYAKFARINHPTASIILYERCWLFWWKEYEEDNGEVLDE